MARPATRRRDGLSKSRVLSWLQCPKRLWLDVNLAVKPPIDAGTEMKFRQGHEVGATARSRFARGVLISPENDLRTALTQTAEALRGRSRRTSRTSRWASNATNRLREHG